MARSLVVMRFNTMRMTAVSSVSGYQSFANSNAQPPGSRLGVFDRPIAGREDLIGDQPIARLLQHRRVGLHAGVERLAASAVSDRGHARLEEELVAFLDDEILDRLDPLGDRRVIISIAEHAQRHHRVDHRGLDAAPAAIDVLVRENPFGAFAERALAERLHRRLAEELQRPSSPRKKFRQLSGCCASGGEA